MASGPKAVPIETCTLWAPACTMAVYQNQYLPAIRSEAIRNFTLFTLTDKAERDDSCANIYHKSLLYLVSNAFESALQKAPFLRERNGEPLLGMAKFNDELGTNLAEIVYASKKSPVTRSRSHGGFDNDSFTMNDILRQVLGKLPGRPFTKEDLDF